LAEKGLIRSEKSCSIALFHPCRHARTVRGIVPREETSHRTEPEEGSRPEPV
jgi:hypothetical protein